VKATVAQTVAAFGGVDVLFNNAGFNKPVPFFEVDEQNFNSIVRVNTLGALIGMQEVGKRMIGSRRKDHQ
jgi:meso-butanediol dehydrogenase / (S,S)-butanediol dehydrogenase / diacetyl reductase